MTFNVILALGGCGVCVFMVAQIYRIVRIGSIPRREGLKAATPRDTPFIYYGYLFFVALSTIIVGWGTAVIISRLLAP